MPTPSATTLRLSSSDASSSSRRTSALACSATVFAASPTPGAASVSWVGMASPVDPFCEDDPGGEADADDEPRGRTAARLAWLPGPALAELWPGRRDDACSRILVRRSLSLRACLDQARL